MFEEDSKTCKVVLVGDSGVGKTCINNRFVENVFSGNVLPSSAASFAKKELILDDIGGKKVLFEIWDTAGQEQYRSISKIFYKGAGAAILIYEITNINSFNNIKDYWIKQIRDHGSKNINKFLFI